MAPRTPLVLFLFLFLFFKYSDSLGLTTRLIHHDSIFHNASETTADRAWRATRSSLARHAYLSSRSQSASTAAIQVELVPAKYHSAFFVNFSIGNPPVTQLVVMDTGSRFLWVKCLPCSPCWPVEGFTYFDPAKSTTFAPRPCTKDCKKCSGSWPWSTKHCMYEIGYADGYYTEGIYANEQLTLRSSDDQTTTVRNISFGCGNSFEGGNAGHHHSNGILGLGVGDPDALLNQHSFFDQFNYKFSYCIAGISDPPSTDSGLAFGDAAQLVGSPTPFYIVDSLYRLTLVNISLGTKMLDIDVEVLKKMSFRKGVVIDSGSTLLHLYDEAFNVVRAEIDMVAGRIMSKVPTVGPPYELCYTGRVDKDAVGFPTLVFHFDGDATIEMENTGIFQQLRDNTICVAIVRSESISAIGILAQLNLNVGFDLKEKNIYLETVGDCSLFV